VLHDRLLQSDLEHVQLEPLLALLLRGDSPGCILRRQYVSTGSRRVEGADIFFLPVDSVPSIVSKENLLEAPGSTYLSLFTGYRQPCVGAHFFLDFHLHRLIPAEIKQTACKLKIASPTVFSRS
jgi:hypothetical protein